MTTRIYNSRYFDWTPETSPVRKSGAVVSDRSVLCCIERKVAAMELQRLYDERKAAERTPSEQAYNYTEINQNLTILLGIASGQEQDIKLMQGDLDIIRERITSLEGKLEQVLQHLAALTAKLE